MSKGFYEKMWETIKVKKQVFKAEIENRRKNGEKYIAVATISPLLSEDEELMGFVGIEEDITEMKKAVSELKNLSQLMVGRELRMAELKKELDKLKSKS